MRVSVRLVSLLALLLVPVTLPARAGIITYELQSLGGDQWRYDYAVTNDELPDPVTFFTVYFPPDLYTGMCGGSFEAPCGIEPTTASGWLHEVIQPDTSLPDAGYFNVFTDGPGIALGETLGGFSISFQWLASGAPGSQPFEFFAAGESDDGPFFDVIDSGTTTPAGPVSVPEPGTLPLLALGMLGLAFYQRLFTRFAAVAGRGGRRTRHLGAPRGGVACASQRGLEA